MDNPGYISMHCWNGKHSRCTGWLVIPDESDYGRATRCDQSIACACVVCLHPMVARYRHKHERTSVKGATWSSSTTTRS